MWKVTENVTQGGNYNMDLNDICFPPGLLKNN